MQSLNERKSTNNMAIDEIGGLSEVEAARTCKQTWRRGGSESRPKLQAFKSDRRRPWHCPRRYERESP